MYKTTHHFPVTDHVLFLDIKPIQYAEFTDCVEYLEKPILSY